MNTENNIKENFFVKVANNSLKNRKKTLFNKFLKEVFMENVHEYVYNNDNVDYLIKWSPKKWYDNLVNANKQIPIQLLDEIYDDIICCRNRDIDKYCDVLASVGYDKYGMAHSGYNEIFEFFGYYFLKGSDYGEGPEEDFGNLFEYLAVDDPDNDVYISNKAEKLLLESKNIIGI